MSTIYSAFYLLFLLSTISAVASPRIIYSAIIHNRQSSRIRCNVIWLVPSGATLQSDTFSIEVNDSYTVDEQIIDMGTWDARAVINSIQCDNLVLNAPFKGVQGPSVYWKFVVGWNRILSIQPNSFLS
jgi:hypothetical protein